MTQNQQNAQHSTGPKTPEGKARSAQNARKHGLSANEFVLRPDEQDAFDQLATQFAEELQPEGILEQTVFTLLIQAQWNLRRCRQNEADLMAQGLDPLLDDTLDKTLSRLDRYAKRHERLFFKALNELKLLQTARAERAQMPVQNEPDTPPLADPKKVRAAIRVNLSELQYLQERIAKSFMRGQITQDECEAALRTLTPRTSASGTNH